ncbi:MAG: hypothetical protein KAI83_12420 [Thiomargarita sp.]|nr:hypothetical protein [Thiomargarita sp.]
MKIGVRGISFFEKKTNTSKTLQLWAFFGRFTKLKRCTPNHKVKSENRSSTLQLWACFGQFTKLKRCTPNHKALYSKSQS